MSARCVQTGAVVSRANLTRRKAENRGETRRFSMALRANHLFSAVLRGSPFFLRVKYFAVPIASDAAGVLS